MKNEKLENKIKTTLTDRTIKPSENSWTKLEALLDEKENRKHKKVWYKYVIAASVFLLLSIVVYNTTAVKKDKVYLKVVNNDDNTNG